MMNMINQYARHKARKLAVQAIYQWQVVKDPIDYIIAQFLAEANPKKVDVEYFSEIVLGAAKNSKELDEHLLPVLDRSLDDLNLVELAVLRLALYELVYRLDVPYKVIINEALKLTKTFGSSEGFKYVNGVLDKVAKKLREKEIR